MRTLSRLALGVFACVLMGPAPDAAAQIGRAREQQNNRDRVCVYQDIQYRGWEQCFSAGDELPNLQNRKDAISSIRIFGRARVTVYDESNFEGRSAEFDSNVPDLGLRNLSGSRSWSDRIESIRVADTDGGFFGRGRGRDNGNGRNDRDDRNDRNDRGDDRDLRDRICLYENANYQGRSECFEAGEQVRDLGRQGNLSDRVSSIRIFGRSTAVLYRDIQFQGDRVTITQDIPDLADLRGRGFGSWNDQVSSLEIQVGRARLR